MCEFIMCVILCLSLCVCVSVFTLCVCVPCCGYSIVLVHDVQRLCVCPISALVPCAAISPSHTVFYPCCLF
jgi:hypothetical protein